MGNMVKKLYERKIKTPHGEKTVVVMTGDMLSIEEHVDVLTVSSFARSYHPTPGTLFGSLYKAGIDVGQLAEFPYIDLRDTCDVWLSESVKNTAQGIGRIGCVEMRGLFEDTALDSPLEAIRAYFHLIDLATISGVEIKTLALPLLGAGAERMNAALVLIPIVSECLAFLQRNPCIEKIMFVDIRPDRAAAFVETLTTMYSLTDMPEEEKAKPAPLAFISYSSKDKNIADNLCNKLESRGIRVWYAPRNVVGPYATAIMKGIKEATYFIVIVSGNSLESQHVLNEIDNAHKRLPALKFKPLRLEDIELSPEFSYYLSRQHWLDATVPPIEAKLEEFVDDILADVD